MNPRAFLSTLLLLLWLTAGGAAVRAQGPLAPDLPVRAEGSWTPGGVYGATQWPAALADPARRPRAWGSWSGSDAGTGSLTLGPFPVPANGRVVLAVAGYPSAPGNRLFLRRTSDGAEWPVLVPDARESWAEVRVGLPADWAGQAAELVAVDGATGLGGWLGVSEPYDRAFGAAQPAGRPVPDYPRPAGRVLPAMLAALALNFLCGAAPGLCLLPALRRRVALPDALAPLVACGLSAACGYGVFWVYSVDGSAGLVASWAVTLGGLAGLAGQALTGGRTFRRALGGGELGAAGGLTVLAGALYLGMLYLPAAGSTLLPGALAEQRFLASPLPPDNLLPQIFADRLYRGQEVRPRLLGDWHASDRPPLQVGVLLLTRPVVLAALRRDVEIVDQTAGLWFQLAWVSAAWALLRGAGLGRRSAGRVVAAVVPVGFLFLNSVYVWPKLGGAALAAGAFALLLQRGRTRPTVPQAATAGALAGLGLLSHGAVVFGLLGMVPFLLLPSLFPGGRQTLAGVAAVLALNGPWVLYGKFYDPPADRLLKWHLAGAVEVDPRPFGQTLREAYAAAGREGAWANKRANAVTLAGGNLLEMTSLAPDGAARRRHEEFYHLFRALGVWNLGWWAGLFLLGRAAARRWRRTPLSPSWPVGTRDLALAVGVSVLATAVWCLLMFGPATTVNHQGSYGPPLFGFLCLATFLEAASPTLFLTVAGFNAALFAATYGPAPAGLAAEGARPDPPALAVAAAAGLGLLACVAWPAKNRLPTDPGASPLGPA